MTSDDWDEERWLGMARNGQERLRMSGMTTYNWDDWE